MPPATPLQFLESGVSLPYMIIADDAFPLQENIMKPYPHRNLDPAERIFNYRLSRARRVVENVFGILANRFRVFQAPIALEPEKIEMIILACCSLHNYLRSHESAQGVYTPPSYVDREDADTHEPIPGSWRDNLTGTGFHDMDHMKARNATKTAKKNRDILRDYFTSPEGSVDFQWNKI